jgi:hypothetical protein
MVAAVAAEAERDHLRIMELLVLVAQAEAVQEPVVFMALHQEQQEE